MRALIATLSLALMAGLAHANPECEAKAVDKNGKALAGAAKASFVKKCAKETTGNYCTIRIKTRSKCCSCTCNRTTYKTNH